ncbi:hypothetical protein C4D60_Mb10t27620 [Musa balbisiana]|uniref:Uncharacterized protein n=1 Tax=Musa balbisiana TaxID=52838 RepID=A0A4S8J0A3_MUSBA|nr:hypothetical protein C4D60_Mb10t27620 [Musa balbisiana]
MKSLPAGFGGPSFLLCRRKWKVGTGRHTKAGFFLTAACIHWFRWRDVKLSAFESAKRRTYVDLRVINNSVCTVSNASTNSGMFDYVRFMFPLCT